MRRVLALTVFGLAMALAASPAQAKVPGEGGVVSESLVITGPGLGKGLPVGGSLSMTYGDLSNTFNTTGKMTGRPAAVTLGPGYQVVYNLQCDTGQGTQTASVPVRHVPLHRSGVDLHPGRAGRVPRLGEPVGRMGRLAPRRVRNARVGRPAADRASLRSRSRTIHPSLLAVGDLAGARGDGPGARGDQDHSRRPVQGQGDGLSPRSDAVLIGLGLRIAALLELDERELPVGFEHTEANLAKVADPLLAGPF